MFFRRFHPRWRQLVITFDIVTNDHQWDNKTKHIPVPSLSTISNAPLFKYWMWWPHTFLTFYLFKLLRMERARIYIFLPLLFSNKKKKSVFFSFLLRCEWLRGGEIHIRSGSFEDCLNNARPLSHTHAETRCVPVMLQSLLEMRVLDPHVSYIVPLCTLWFLQRPCLCWMKGGPEKKNSEMGESDAYRKTSMTEHTWLHPVRGRRRRKNMFQAEQPKSSDNSIDWHPHVVWWIQKKSMWRKESDDFWVSRRNKSANASR